LKKEYPMRRTAKYAGIVTIVLLMASRLSWASAPIIRDWSSTGGHPVNKDNPKDRMYLVKGGDKITFTVKAKGAEKYIWQVNKEVQKGAEGNTFTFTVPNEKGTWEIHVIAISGKDKAHAEWVISTLTKEEAPTFFDYFTDGKWTNRKQTDPWGRTLPEWSQPRGIRHNTTRCFLDAGKRGSTSVTMMAPCNAAYGTWKWRCVRYPKRSSIIFGNGGFSAGTSTPAYLYFNLSGKTTGFTANPWPAENITPSEWGGRKGEWLGQTVIRTHDGWYYRFIDGDLVPNTLARENTRSNCSHVVIKSFWNAHIDCIEVYKNRYLWPSERNRVRYGQYITHFHWTYKPRRGFYPVERRKGIIVAGHEVTLKEIANLLGRNDLFKYDDKSKTALCSTDLVVLGGASLIIKDEKLRFHSPAPGGCYFRLKNGAEVRIINSTVESDTAEPFYWMLTSDLNFERYKDNREERDWGNDVVNFAGRLIIRNSVIRKSGWLLIHGARQIVLENVKFLEMVNVDKGSYGPSGGLGNRVKFRKAIGGKYAFQLFNRYTLFGDPPFMIKGCVFSGGSEPANISLIGSDHIGKINIYDTDFSKAVLSFRKHPRWFQWFSTWPSEKNCPEQRWFNGTFNLINCKLPSTLKVQTDRAYVLPKYYLDVRVVNKSGKPVAGAYVSVRNETDAGYPPENIQPVVTSFVDCIDEQLAWPNSTKWIKIRDIDNCIDPQDIPAFLMKHAVCNTPGYSGEVSDIRKDEKGRITHFVDRGYRHFSAWKSTKTAEARVTFEYDFTYDDDGLLVRYTKTRVCYPPTKGWWGWGRKSKYVYTLKYKRENGHILGYSITEKWAGSADKKVDDLTWYVPVKVKTNRDGHTPLPSDGLHTIILTDYLMDNSNKKEFTYTITVEKDGKRKIIKGVDPGPEWYRPDPNKPTYTVVVVLDK